MTVKDFFIQLISDENNIISSKRLAGLLCVIALVVALMANVFSCGKMNPSDTLVDAVALFAFGALGLTSIDKFIKNKK
jgi:hypothetical protein